MAHLRMEKISEIVYDIYQNPMEYSERRTTFSRKYPHFAASYPVLFDMVCLPRFNIDKFLDLNLLHEVHQVQIQQPPTCRKRNRDDSNYTFERRLYSMHKSQLTHVQNEYLI